MGGRRGRGTASVLLGQPVEILVRSHLLLRLRAGGSLTGARWATERLTFRGVRIPRLRGRVDIRNPTRPRIRTAAWSAVKHRLLRLLRRRPRARASPLRPGGTDGACGLVSLRMDISRLSRRRPIGLPVAEQLQPALDVRVCGVQLGSPLVRVKGIGNLVVAGLILKCPGSVNLKQDMARKERETHQSAQIIPDFRDPGVEADGTRVRIKRVTVLIDLIVKHANGAPERGVPAIAVHSLLVGFVCLGVLLHLHVAATQKIPALGIRVVCQATC